MHGEGGERRVYPGNCSFHQPKLLGGAAPPGTCSCENKVVFAVTVGLQPCKALTEMACGVRSRSVGTTSSHEL